MKIKVSHKLAQIFHSEQFELQLNRPISVRELISLLCSLYPGLSEHRGEMEQAVFCKGHRLKHDDPIHNDIDIIIG